jgi:hypothetical protein
MIHGPLAKVDNQAFGSIKEILDHIAANPMFMQYADMIAQLFLDRFRCVCVCVYTVAYLNCQCCEVFSLLLLLSLYPLCRLVARRALRDSAVGSVVSSSIAVAVYIHPEINFIHYSLALPLPLSIP